MTIRATQKNRMSHPVSSMVEGKNAFRSSADTSGQPRPDMGNNPELNQVSRTSESCSTSTWSIGRLRDLAA